MSERRAVTKVLAKEHLRASKARKGAILDHICAVTIDRRLKAERAKLNPRGRSHTKPGTLLKDSILKRT